MNDSSKLKQVRLPSLAEAVILILVSVAVVVVGLSLGSGGVQGALLPLLMATGVVALYGLYLGNSWKKIQDGVIDSISKIIVAILILMLIGSLVGLWIASGTIPSLIYYGLNLISPSFFLGATFLVASLLSLATGSSWATIGSVGVALMGIGTALGISPGIIAGAVVSGALFGDKMSPLSDTTNMASAIAEVDLFKHIRSMIWTTGPAAIIVFIVFWIVGANTGGTANLDQIKEMQAGLIEGWNISFWHLLPIAIMFLGRKVPSLITLFASVIIGAIWAMMLQGAGLRGMLEVATSGFQSDTGVEMVDNVLSAGGLSSMQVIVILILCATAFGGALNAIGILDVLVKGVVSKVKSTAGLVTSTLGSSYILAFLTGNQALPIILPGVTFKSAYDDKGIDRSVLSRSVEDAGTIVVPLVPWGAMTGFITVTLGVGFTEYWPFLWLTFLVPIIAIFYAITGIAIWKNPEPSAIQVQEDERKTV